MDINNNEVLEAETKKALAEYEANFTKLGTLLKSVIDTALDTQDQFRKIKTITFELRDFNDKFKAYAENQGVQVQHAKGYVPPTNSTGDADYLKEVPNKLNKYNA